MRPTWDSLAPLLSGSVGTEEEVCRCVGEHWEFIYAYIQNQTWGSESHDTIASDICTALEEKVRRTNGMTCARQGSAVGWFKRVLFNLKNDWFRSRKRRNQPPQPRPQRRQKERELLPEERVARWDAPSQRNLERLLQNPDRAGIPETHVLALLALTLPGAVELAHVQRASEYDSQTGSRAGQKGLLREESETWTVFVRWREAFEERPWTTTGRTGLAWVMRSTDAGPMETWAQREPQPAKIARGTINRWVCRAVDLLLIPRPPLR